MRVLTTMISGVVFLLPLAATAQTPPNPETLRANASLQAARQAAYVKLMNENTDAALFALGVKDSLDDAALAEKIRAEPAHSLDVAAMAALAEKDPQMGFIAMGAQDTPSGGPGWAAAAGAKLRELRDSNPEMVYQAMTQVMTADPQLGLVGFGVIDSVDRANKTAAQQKAEEIILQRREEPRVKMSALSGILKDNKPLAYVAMGAANGRTESETSRRVMEIVTPPQPGYQVLAATILMNDDEDLMRIAMGMQDGPGTADATPLQTSAANVVRQLRPYLNDVTSIQAINRDPNLARFVLGLGNGEGGDDITQKARGAVRGWQDVVAPRQAANIGRNIDFLNGKTDPCVHTA